MNYKRTKILTACIAFLLLACNRNDKANNTGTTTISADTTLDTLSAGHQNNAAKLKPEEAAFIEKAAVGGLMEVEAGNLTLQKTKKNQIKEFAERMIKDHTKANNELQTLAAGLGVKLPDALPSAEQSHLAAMKQMMDNEYDENYMDMMVNDHSKTIDLFNGASRFGNAVISSFAKKTLPVLMEHNKMAVTLDSLAKVKNKNRGPKGDDLPNVDKHHKN
jgi:putative membrane protein